jgi:hypothetical protein
MLAILYPNTGGVKATALSGRPASVYVRPASFPLTGARREAARQVARAFLVDAVLREDPAAAWQFVAPSLRRGTARVDWRHGNIPVVPYRADALLIAKWKLSYAYADRAGFEVGLFPKPGRSEQATKFTLELKMFGRGPTRRWLVSSWAPAPTLDPVPPSANPSSPGATVIPAAAAPGGRLRAWWLVFPLGIVLLAMVAPVCIGLREWRRGVRAARAHGSRSVGPVTSRAEGPRSS